MKSIKSLFNRIIMNLRLFGRSFGANWRRKGGLLGRTKRLTTRLRRREPRAIAGCAAAGVLLVAIPVVIVLAGKSSSAAAERITAEPAAAATGMVVIELTPSPSPESTPVPTPTPIRLEEGFEGEIVHSVQDRLMQLGYMDYDETTNLYGPATSHSVELFQRGNGFEIDGILVQEQYDLLMSENAPKYMVALGISGTDVKELQKRLREMDYLDKATGYFGDETETAVVEFQKRNNLSVDGKVGEQTREMLYSEDAVPMAISYGAQSDDVKKYQQRLFKLGYLTTEPDGNFGKDTVAAVKLFQQTNGLIADGYIGPTTRTLLMSSDAQASAITIGYSGRTVEQVQKYLKELGYLKKVTGYYGSDTEGAVRAFQKENSLSVDGKVGRKTMSVLTGDSAKQYSGTAGDSGTQGSGGGSSSSGGSSSGSSGYGYGADAFISAAKSKVGCRYVRGGKGPNTFDCSGLVYWCLNQAGVKQGYLTSYGWRSVTKYQKISSLSDIRKGDVLVLRGHVAIAAGDGMMYDASSSNGKVVYRSCTSNYVKNYFICAFRIF